MVPPWRALSPVSNEPPGVPCDGLVLAGLPLVEVRRRLEHVMGVVLTWLGLAVGMAALIAAVFTVYVWIKVVQLYADPAKQQELAQQIAEVTPIVEHALSGVSPTALTPTSSAGEAAAESL